MINRKKALAFLNKNIENKNIIKHMIATEALMGGVYDFLKKRKEKNLGGTREEWLMAGLLHDGDYKKVEDKEHGIKVSQMLEKEGLLLPSNVKHAMAAHNFHQNGVSPETKMDWALFCGDSLTGLIVAATLVLPSKKLSDLTCENVLNRFSEKRFAAGTRREDISLCEKKLGISLEEFVKIALEATKKVAKELGL